MNKLVYVIISLSILSFAFSQDRNRASKNDNVFTKGEYLKYEAGYGWIVGGEAELLLQTKKYKGKELYYARGSAKTIGVADVLYKVHDVYESYFDPQTGLPLFAIENKSEGPHYKFYNELNFFHEKNLVKTSKKGKTDTIPSPTFDILSAVYQLRNSVKNNIKVGDRITLHTYFNDENWDLIVRYIGDETLKMDFGKVKCYKFLPMVQEGEIFKDQDALSIWVSKDEAKIPVKVEFELWVGSFTAELIDYKGLKYPINVK